MQPGVNRRPGFNTRRSGRKTGNNVVVVAPSITALSANSGERWFANRTLTITGTYFYSGATVTFGSTAGISASYSSGALTFTIPESELYEAGPKYVTVTYQGLTSSPVTYTVNQPASLYAGYRADSGITLNGSNVSSWSDYTGKNKPVINATTTTQPSYVSTDSNFNGQPSVSFAADKKLTCLTATFGSVATPFTYFSVVRNILNTSAVGVADSAESPQQALYFTSGYARLYSSGTGLSTVPIKRYINFPLTSVFGSTCKLYVGSNTAAASTTGPTIPVYGLTVGNTLGGTQGGNDIAELDVFNTSLTDEQISILNRYAAFRYKSHAISKSDIAAMPAARAFAAASQLGDGRIVVAGGANSSAAFSNVVQIYDHVANSWSTGTSVPASVLSSVVDIRHNIVTLPNGNVFLYAGDANYGGYFDGNTWTTTSNTLTQHGAGSKVVLMSNGKVGIFGGASTGTRISLYDPATNQFSASTASITSRAYWGAAVSLNNGNVLLIAGDSTNRNCELYDPATDTVTSTGILNSARVRIFSSKLSTGKVIVIGSGSTAEVYDPATGVWTNLSNGTTQSIDTNWYGCYAGRFPDGSTLLPGAGTGRVNVFAERESAFHDVQTRSTEAYGCSIVNMSDGRVFVAGGNPQNVSGGAQSAISDAAIFVKA